MGAWMARFPVDTLVVSPCIGDLSSILPREEPFADSSLNNLFSADLSALHFSLNGIDHVLHGHSWILLLTFEVGFPDWFANDELL